MRDIGLQGELLAFGEYRFNAEDSPERVIWTNIDNYVSECNLLVCKQRIYSDHQIRGVIPLNVPGIAPGITRSLLLITEKDSIIVDVYFANMSNTDASYNLTSFRNVRFQEEPAVIVTSTDSGKLTLMIIGVADDGVVSYRLNNKAREWVMVYLPDMPVPIGPISFIDLNGDCAADLAYLDNSGKIRIFYNNRDGTRFSSNITYNELLDHSIEFLESASSITFGDLLGSGFQDIILSDKWNI